MQQYELLPPLRAYIGPKRPKMIVLGEAWGRTEALFKQPFAGESGKELFRILGDALGGVDAKLDAEHARVCSFMRDGDSWIKHRRDWLEAQGIGYLNTLNFQPPDNKLEPLCVSRNDLPGWYRLPPLIGSTKYLHPSFGPELLRLKDELSELRPNIVVAVGNTASWAMLGQTSISLIRGAIAWSEKFGRKVLPTYHPAALLRQWNLRPLVLADFMKAKRHDSSSEFHRPARRILIDPTLSEVIRWTEKTLSNPPPRLGVDIETSQKLITCIGFASSRSEAICIPLSGPGTGNNYWPSVEDELKVREQLQKLLGSDIPKVFQNGVYDLQYLFKDGYRVRACLEDTMLLHHSIFPELPKGLGFLGSCYTDEVSWKLMMKRRPDEVEKKDE